MEIVAVEAEIDEILHNKAVKVIHKMRHVLEASIETEMKYYKAQTWNQDRASNVLNAISLDIIAIGFHMQLN